MPPKIAVKELQRWSNRLIDAAYSGDTEDVRTCIAWGLASFPEDIEGRCTCTSSRRSRIPSSPPLSVHRERIPLPPPAPFTFPRFSTVLPIICYNVRQRALLGVGLCCTLNCVGTAAPRNVIRSPPNTGVVRRRGHFGRARDAPAEPVCACRLWGLGSREPLLRRVCHDGPCFPRARTNLKRTAANSTPFPPSWGPCSWLVHTPPLSTQAGAADRPLQGHRQGRVGWDYAGRADGRADAPRAPVQPEAEAAADEAAGQ